MEFVDRNKLNDKSKNIMYLRDWVQSVQIYIKNAKEIWSEDIRKYLELIKKDGENKIFVCNLCIRIRN